MPVLGEEIFQQLSSKSDLYNHMGNHLQVSILNFLLTRFQYYMPTYEIFTKDLAKEIFAGNKKLLKMRDVKFINVVKYDELSVKNLYSKLLSLDGMGLYFPSRYPKGR